MIALDCSLQFVFLGKFSVFLNKSIDTINHLLHQLDFRISQSMLVGNVISNAWKKNFSKNIKNLIFNNIPVWPPDSPLVPLG